MMPVMKANLQETTAAMMILQALRAGVGNHNPALAEVATVVGVIAVGVIAVGVGAAKAATAPVIHRAIAAAVRVGPADLPVPLAPHAAPGLLEARGILDPPVPRKAAGRISAATGNWTQASSAT
jgi:hypothetical protein